MGNSTAHCRRVLLFPEEIIFPANFSEKYQYISFIGISMWMNQDIQCNVVVRGVQGE